MANNKYYDMFISGNINHHILNTSLANANFEDHYWHMACLVEYYKSRGQTYLEKLVLGKVCDLNYIYNALFYYNTRDVLPSEFKQYLCEFKNGMADKKIEDEIAYFNKQDKKKQRRRFWIYCASGLLVIPLMLLLTLVFKMDTTYSVIVSVLFLFATQFIFNPQTIEKWQNKKLMKTQDVEISKELEGYIKYIDRFRKLVNDDLYIKLVREKNEEKINKIVEEIKTTRKL